MLAGSGALAIGSPAASAAVTWQIFRNGTDVHVRMHGFPDWILTPADFGSGATVDIGSSHGPITVDFRLHGGERVQMLLGFRMGDQHPMLHAEFAAWPKPGATQAVPLVGFLAGQHALQCQVTTSAARAALVPGVHLPLPMELDLRPGSGLRGMQLVLRGASGPFHAADFAWRMLQLCPTPAKAAPAWRARALDPGFPARLALGRTAASTVTLDVPGSAMLHVEAGPAPMRIEGRLAMHVRTGPSTEGPILAGSATMGAPSVGAVDYRVDLTLWPGHWSIYTRNVMAGVSGGQDDAPFRAVVARRGTALTVFHVPVALHDMAVGVAGAEFSRLDFNGANCALTLGTHAVGTGLHLPLGAVKAVTVPLEAASLRVASSVDLMSLRFLFSGLALKVAPGPPQVMRTGTADVLLVAEFPPQHVLERAYLRQDAPIPDPPKPLDESQLERLRAGGPDIRETLSKALHEHAANKDGLGEFDDFAKAWKAKAPPGEVPWLGTAGVMQPRLRAMAREIAWNLITESTQKAIKKLDDANADAVVNALNVIGVPDLGLRDVVVADIRTRTGDVREAAKQVFRLAARSSADVRAITDAWTAWSQGKGLRAEFITEAWPPELKEWNDLPDRVPPAEARTFLRNHLDLLLKGRSQVGVPYAGEGFSRPATARLSGPSRLAFEVPQKTATIAFSLEALTDWASMDLRVVRRAERFKVDGKEETRLSAILKHQGILAARTMPEGRLADIAGTMQKPSVNETALELPSRLLLSPDQDAKWHVPRPVPAHIRAVLGSRVAALWQAELVERDPAAPSLRAIWSPDFKPGFPTEGTFPDAGLPGLKPHIRFRSSMDALDRHELVGLGSMHGLPVLARRGPDQSLHSSQSVAEGYAITRNGQTSDAIYLPKAMRAFRLSLSSLGGSLDAEAQFTPPAAPTLGGADLFEAFSLERWTARIAFGRDILVEVVRKGTLYPLGCQSSLVRTTQREIIPEYASDGSVNGIAAAAVQRLAVETTPLPKLFPAPLQPNEGRGCFARSVQVLTTRTPDLLDPLDALVPTGTELQETLLGRVGGSPDGKPFVGLIFWPRTQPGAIGTVRFRVLQDGQPQQVPMPLLFVDNRAAHDKRTMEALQRYWNRPAGDDAPPRRFNVVQHGGVPRSYAEEKREGACTFITDWQEIDVAARSVEPHVITEAMEAADQPSYYPVLRQALVRPQQVATLSGSPAAPLRVRHTRRYVQEGYKAYKDDTYGQRFLDVIGAPGAVAMGRNGDRGGGLGQQHSTIVAFDAELGPDMRPASVATASLDPLETLLAGRTLPPFFEDDARLLGLISLNDLVSDLAEEVARDAAPRLVEVVEYAKAKANDAPIADVLEAIAKPIRTVRLALKAQSAIQAIYGGLDKALADAEAALDPPLNLSAVLIAGRRLMDELRRLADAPLAPLAGFVQDGLQKALADLRTTFESLPLWNQFATPVRAALRALLSDGAAAAALVGNVADLPGLTDAERRAVEASLRAAVAAPATWDSADPLRTIHDAVLADPAVQTALGVHVSLLKDAVLAGPLATELLPIATALRAIAARDLAAATGQMLALLDAVAGLEQFATGAGNQCAAAIDAVHRWVEAATPPNADVDGLVAIVKDGVDTVGRLPTALASPGLPDTVAPFATWATNQQPALVNARDRVQTAANALKAARADALSRLVAASACAALDGATVTALQNVRAARAAMVEASLAWTRALVDGPVAPIPAGGAAALIDGAAGPLGQARTAAIRLAGAATLAGGTAARQTALVQALRKVGDADPLVKAMTDATAAWTGRATEADALAQTALQSQATAAQDLATKVLSDVEGAVAEAQAEALTLLLRAALTTVPEIRTLIDEAATASGAAGKAFSLIYQTALTARREALVTLESHDAQAKKILGDVPARAEACGAAQWGDALLLVPGGNRPCGPENDLMHDESVLVASGPAGLRTVLNSWKAGRSALQRIQALAPDLLMAGLRSTVTRLLDVDGARRALEDALRTIVPLRRTVQFDLKMPLPPKEIGPFELVLDPGPADLVLSSKTTVSLMPGDTAVTAAFAGALPPFHLIIAKTLDIQFAAMSYTGGTGQSGALSAKVEGVKFKGQLEFLATLQKWLNPGGSGPFVRLLPDRPGIEAGYVLSLGIISIGTLSFSNINFAASCLLPFDNQEALLAFSLGTLDQPFLISAAPYGGGGFFGLEAGRKGIVAGHASFEYGGVAAVKFGPLEGIGRITTGVYVKQSGNSVVLTGLFFAGFAGHIACFGVTTAFTLRIRCENGAMSGEASLSFSFSMGLFDVKFTVKAVREVKEFKQPEQGAKKATLLDRYPGSIQVASTGIVALPAAPTGEVTSDATTAHRHWGRHAAYYDLALRPARMAA